MTVTMSRNTLNCKRKNMKKTTLEHLIVKLIKAEVKENILNQPKKSYTLNSRAFSKALVGKVEAGRQWNDTFKVPV